MDAATSFRAFGDAVIGDWVSESTHQLLPGTVIDGRATFEWLEPGTFLLWREAATHPDFPGSALAVIGGNDDLRMHYFDSRGVVRVFEMRIDEGALTFTRTGDPDFDQRLTWTLDDDGTLRGLAEIREEGETWADDLWTTYRRA